MLFLRLAMELPLLFDRSVKLLAKRAVRNPVFTILDLTMRQETFRYTVESLILRKISITMVRISLTMRTDIFSRFSYS